MPKPSRLDELERGGGKTLNDLEALIVASDLQWGRPHKYSSIETLIVASEKRHLERMESIDRRLAATSKLLHTGAKVLLQLAEAQKKLVENLTHPVNGDEKR